MIKKIERADGPRWQVYGRKNGKKVYVSTHETEKEAKKAEKKHEVLQDQIKAGELPPEVDGKRLTGPALDEWLKAIAKQRSHESYTSRVKNHVKPTLADVVLMKVTAAKLEDLAEGLASGAATLSKEPVSRSTIDGVLGMLGSFFSYCEKKGWIPKKSNPVPDVDLTGRVVDKVKAPIEWISNPADVTRLIAACSPSIRTLVAVMLGTGLRLDEALHLRWVDVDLAHRMISVQRGRKGPPKSGKPRTVEIFDGVLPVLQEMKLAAGKNVLLWPSPVLAEDGTQQPRAQSSVSVPFKNAVRKAGLASSLHVHSCRHTFAGTYLSNGGDIYRLSKLLGHYSVKITEETYGHLVRSAFEQDRGRVAFAMPKMTDAKVIAIRA